MRTILKLILLVLPTITNAQFVVSASTNFTISEDATMAIQANGVAIYASAQFSIFDNPSISETPYIKITNAGALINNSTFDFSATTLDVELTGATQGITGNFVISRLGLLAVGNKVVNGNLTILNAMTFTKGILQPSTGKILYTGDLSGITEDNDQSYVEGPFYNAGSSPKKFPIGAGGIHAPAVLVDATDGEVGIEVHNESALLQIDNVDLIDMNTDRYWQIVNTDLTKIDDSRISLSLNGISDAFLDSEGGATVAQAASTSAMATNLGTYSGGETEVISQDKVSAPILAIGKESKIVLKIHDLITPFGSPGENDRLYIDKIHRFAHRTVTLLDRWGVEVAKWKDYTNDNNYDFSNLSPGNYICIVQYGNEGEKDKVEQQMVTVLKTN